MSSASPNRLKDAEHLLQRADVPNESTSELDDAPISAEEAAALRSEKLEAIKQAIDEGVYDSDDLLEEAMRRLRESIRNEE